jgi:outer membrane protein OmpA-like peptidoglycan-associated protein
MGKTLVRFWQQLWTDVSIPERRIVVGMLGFQVGLPFHREPEITVSDKVSLSAAKAVTPMQEIKISLDAQQVFFSTNKARLKKTVQEALADVGRYLRANPENVSQVVISGHADRRGSFAYNLKLSQRRAQEVVSAIGAGSGSSSWLRLESHSYSNPIDSAYTPKAWAKNRRVELVFREVKNPDELMRKLEPLTRFQPVVD